MDDQRQPTRFEDLNDHEQKRLRLRLILQLQFAIPAGQRHLLESIGLPWRQVSSAGDAAAHQRVGGGGQVPHDLGVVVQGRHPRQGVTCACEVGVDTEWRPAALR